MDGFLKESTSATVLLGKFVDSTDGVTEETGLTIANTDIKISKNGAAFANKNSGGATHSSAGYYSMTLDATDTNSVGRMKVSCNVAGALYVEMNFQVIESAIYDALFASGATGYSTFNATSDTVANVTTVGTCNTNTDMRGTNDALLATSAPLNFSDLAITAGTGYITGVTNNVNAEVASLSTIALAQFVGQDIGIYTITEGSIFDTLRDEIINDAPTAGEVADAVWDEATADHTTAGTYGLGVPVSSTTAASVIGPAVWAQPWSNYTVGDTSMGNLMETMLNPTDGVLNSLNDIQASDVWDVLYTAYTGSDFDFGTLAYQQSVVSNNIDTKVNNIQGTGFSSSTDSLEAIRNRGDAAWTTGSGGGGSCGDGANQLTIDTQDTSTDAIQGSQASIVGTSLKVTTGTDGTAVINLDDGTYTLRITAPSGFVDPADRSVTISGADTTESYTLAATTSGSCDVPEI